MPFRKLWGTGSCKSGCVCKATTTIKGAKQTSKCCCSHLRTGRGGGGNKSQPTCRSEFTAWLCLSSLFYPKYHCAKVQRSQPGTIGERRHWTRFSLAASSYRLCVSCPETTEGKHPKLFNKAAQQDVSITHIRFIINQWLFKVAASVLRLLQWLTTRLTFNFISVLTTRSLSEQCVLQIVFFPYIEFCEIFLLIL